MTINGVVCHLIHFCSQQCVLLSMTCSHMSRDLRQQFNWVHRGMCITTRSLKYVYVPQSEWCHHPSVGFVNHVCENSLIGMHNWTFTYNVSVPHARKKEWNPGCFIESQWYICLARKPFTGFNKTLLWTSSLELYRNPGNAVSIPTTDQRNTHHKNWGSQPLVGNLYL